MRLGIDLGGTKIAGIVMDTAGTVVHQQRVATPAAAGYNAIVQAICKLIQTLQQQAGKPCSIGVAAPGALTKQSNVMKNCNITCINGRPLHADLEAALNQKIRLANDADCFALSEARDGAAAGYDVVFGVILGTGVGGGIVMHGKLHSGPNAIAGEWGHTPLVSPGLACYCGQHGCSETVLSGPGLYRIYQQQGGGQAHNAVEIASAAAANEEAPAVAAMQQYLQYFGRGLASVIDVLDPDVVVLGGGLSNIDSLYQAGVQSIATYVFSDSLLTPVVRNRHGDASGVRGAAWLW